jgi:hypothetical protein
MSRELPALHRFMGTVSSRSTVSTFGPMPLSAEYIIIPHPEAWTTPRHPLETYECKMILEKYLGTLGTHLV